ncbi:hypothetical protein N7444_011542 [Penicillium canescens]|nr:hypothetical protein N7444_011542 [Penicillium canescens]
MDDTTAITNVTFTPCARTYWHTHEEGQFLKVVAGLGWIYDKGAEPAMVEAAGCSKRAITPSSMALQSSSAFKEQMPSKTLERGAA